MKKIKFKNLIITILIVALSLMFFAFAAFYSLVVLGVSTKLQTIWICSAMTTLNHKYLATWFFSDEKIEQVLKENMVDDTGYESDIFVIEDKNDEETDEKDEEKVDPYIEEGYTKLEEGLYMKEVSGSSWRGNIMLIADSKRVKLADTKNQFRCGQKVASMIKDNDAVAGINGGGFVDGPNYDSNGGIPAGMLIENGILINPKSANTEDTYNMVGFNKDGVMVLKRCTPAWALENDIVSAVTFSPYIIVNGEGTIKKGTGGWGIAPRTAIGQRKTGEVLFLVIDGRQIGWSIGVDLLPVQDTLLAENCYNAAMMDGGSSTVLIYNDEFVNRPSLGFERYINNCWIVTKAEE